MEGAGRKWGIRGDKHAKFSQLGERNHSLWDHDIQGGGVPVVAGGRAYQFGYYGVEDDLQEALVCFDAVSGEVLWKRAT